MFGLDKLIPADEKRLFVRFALSFMGYISLWAILHDQIIIRIDSRHFTDYHRPILNISNHTLLAIQYGFIATFGLGLVFGMMTYCVSRFGRLRKLPFKDVFLRFMVLSLIVEFICLILGYLEHLYYGSHREHLFYPDFVFPDSTHGIAITQTMNISAYLLAGVSAFIFWTYLYFMRKRT